MRSCVRPHAQQVVVGAGQRDRLRIVAVAIAQAGDRQVEFVQQAAALLVALIMLSIQKKQAMRQPRVTGVT